MDAKPKCPRCGHARNVTVGAGKPGERLMYCSGCRGMFDDSPDEGGTHGDRPDARMMREEDRRNRRRG